MALTKLALNDQLGTTLILTFIQVIKNSDRCIGTLYALSISSPEVSARMVETLVSG